MLSPKVGHVRSDKGPLHSCLYIARFMNQKYEHYYWATDFDYDLKAIVGPYIWLMLKTDESMDFVALLILKI